MWLVSLSLSAAHAQTFLDELDEGSTLELTEIGEAFVADPYAADLDQVFVVNDACDTTVGELYDLALDASRSDTADPFAIEVGANGQLWGGFADTATYFWGTRRVCRPLWELRCTPHWPFNCVWVQIGSTCCASGGTECGDYILDPNAAD
jgi:hypothetical protein